MIRYRTMMLSVLLTLAVLGAKSQRLDIGAKFLQISPDARSSGMGDMGLATGSDEASNYWNPAKMADIDSEYGAILGYTPLSSGVIKGLAILYLAGYRKLSNDWAMGMSVDYYSSPRQERYDESGTELLPYRPYEFSVDMSLSQALSDEFFMGYTLRYVRSNPINVQTEVEIRPANALAVDWGMYYLNRYRDYSIGFALKNIGTKLNNGSNMKLFLPMSLGIGAQCALYRDDDDKIYLAGELNKFLVSDEDSAERDGVPGTIFGGLTQMKNYSLSTGIEGIYRGMLVGRTGVRYGPDNNLARDGLGLAFGAGFIGKHVNVDLSYQLPVQKYKSGMDIFRVSLRLKA